MYQPAYDWFSVNVKSLYCTPTPLTVTVYATTSPEEPRKSMYMNHGTKNTASPSAWKSGKVMRAGMAATALAASFVIPIARRILDQRQAMRHTQMAARA